MPDHHNRTYKSLKHPWRLFDQDENELNHRTVKYYFGLNEYTTTQNIVDLVWIIFLNLKPLIRLTRQPPYSQTRSTCFTNSGHDISPD